MDRGAWWATVYRVARSQTQLKWLNTHTQPRNLCLGAHYLLFFSRSVMSDSLQPHGLQHHQVSLSTVSQTLLKLMFIESVMPFNHLILWIPFSSCLQSFPASQSFPVSQLFPSGSQSIGASVSASDFPTNIHGCFSLGWTGWISLQSKRLSRIFPNTSSKASVLQHSAFFMVQLSHDYWINHSFD